jgi:AraC family transcriptional regulator
MQTRMTNQFQGMGEMKFALRASSSGRFWNGFDAATYNFTRGIAERPPSPTYSIIMHLSAPVTGTCRCEGPTLHRIMGPGDIDIIPLGFAPAWRDDAQGTVLNIKLSPSFVRSTVQAMQYTSPGGPHLQPQLHLKDPILEHLGWALVAQLETGDQPDRLFAESVGSAIATHLLTRFSTLRPPTYTHGLTRRQLQSVIDYINENLTENLSLGELALIAARSVPHFKALFRQSMGVPVHQYVIRQRVNRAVNLLARGDLRLCEVAQQAGFADQSHMTRWMRRMIGVTPAVLLRQYR